jgi:hypothetical protein
MRFPWPGGFSSTVNEEVMMKRFSLPAPAFFFIVVTRALLGAGVRGHPV